MKNGVYISFGLLALGVASYFAFKKGGFLRKKDEQKSNACGEDCSCEKKSNVQGANAMTLPSGRIYCTCQRSGGNITKDVGYVTSKAECEKACGSGSAMANKRRSRTFEKKSNAEGTYKKTMVGNCPCPSTVDNCQKVGYTTNVTNAETGAAMCKCDYNCSIGSTNQTTKSGGFGVKRRLSRDKAFSRADGYGGEQARVITIG